MNQENEQTFILEDFKVDLDNPHPLILITGKRFSGKTETTAALVDKYDYVAKWSAWCRDKTSRDFWTDKFTSINVPFSIHRPNVQSKKDLEDIISEQESKVRKYSRFLNKPFPNKLTLGFVFDSVTGYEIFRKGPQIEDLFSNTKHYKIVCLVNTSHIESLPPMIKLNCDHIFVGHSSKSLLKALYETYVGEEPGFETFKDLAQKVTSQCDSNGTDMYNVLVYNNKSHNNGFFSIYRQKEESDIKLNDDNNEYELLMQNYLQLQTEMTNLNNVLKKQFEILEHMKKKKICQKSLISSYSIV